jgi:hypothetical protein
MNPNLKVKLNVDPFPHLILEDLFTSEELFSIGKEIEFLQESNLSLSALTSAKVQHVDGSYEDKAKYKVIYLTSVFQSWKNSFIARKIRDLGDQGILFLYSQIEPWVDLVQQRGWKENIKINFYENGDKYDEHKDASEFTSLIYLSGEKKLYSGGDLHFPDYSYSYACEHNSLIFFPGHKKHKVSEVKSLEGIESNQTLRVAINTFYSVNNHSEQEI